MKTINQPPKAKTKLTKSQLALALGISRQALNVHLKAPGHPPIDDIAAWEILLAERGRAGTSPPKLRDAIARARLAILKETQKRLARENQVETGKLIVFSDARRQCAAAWCFVFEQLQRGENELPPALAGLSAVEVYERLHAFTERLRGAAKEKFEKIGT
jgi:hypothetical protein